MTSFTRKQKHSHWSCDASKNVVAIEWGQYGSYDVVVNAETKTGEGSLRGDASQWRKMRFLRDIGADKSDHDHDHLH